MPRINRFFLCVWAATLLARAQRPGAIANGYVTTDGLTIRYETVLEPPLKHSDVFPLGTGVKPSENGMHRFIVDGSTHSYFGYDLVVGPAGTPNRHVLSIEPLHVTEKDLAFAGGVAPLKALLLPKYPPPQLVQDGDTLAIDLLISPDGQQKLVDYVYVDSKTVRAAAGNTARDFTLDDGPLNFQVVVPLKLWINGREDQETPALGLHMEAGSTMWLALPGRGTYILSLEPREDYAFQKAGLVRDRSITFHMGTDQFELKTSGPIAGPGHVWNLYVLHDAARERNGPLFGVGRLEDLVHD